MNVWLLRSKIVH